MRGRLQAPLGIPRAGNAHPRVREIPPGQRARKKRWKTSSLSLRSKCSQTFLHVGCLFLSMFGASCKKMSLIFEEVPPQKFRLSFVQSGWKPGVKDRILFCLLDGQPNGYRNNLLSDSMSQLRHNPKKKHRTSSDGKKSNRSRFGHLSSTGSQKPRPRKPPITASFCREDLQPATDSSDGMWFFGGTH